MKNILGTIAKVGIAVILLRVLGFVIVVALIVWLIGALLTSIS